MNDWILYLLAICALGLIPLYNYLWHKHMESLIVKGSIVVNKHPLQTVIGVDTEDWGYLSGVFDHWGLTGYWRTLYYPEGIKESEVISILEYAKSIGEKNESVC